MKRFATTVKATQELQGDAAAPQKPNPRRRLGLIQSSRGLAALLVVLFHTTQLSRDKLHQVFLFDWFQFGDAGVNFFFVLSGFIVFWVHRFDVGHPDRLQLFIQKRFIRIYPLYWMITLLLIPIYVLIPSFGQGYEHTLNSIFKSLLLFPQEHLPILIVGWSLSYEILFYFVFSLTILLQPKLSRKIVFIWLAVTILNACLALVNAEFLQNSFLFQFVFSVHNLEFFLGCLAAYLVNQLKIRQGFLFLVWGIILFAFYAIAPNHQSTLERVLFCGIPSGLIVFGAASLDLSRSLSLPRFFPYLGDASYSIYLVHYPVLSAAIKLTLAHNFVGWLGYAPTLSLVLITAIGVGCLTYTYFEKPVLTFLRHRLLAIPSTSPTVQ